MRVLHRIERQVLWITNFCDLSLNNSEDPEVLHLSNGMEVKVWFRYLRGKNAFLSFKDEYGMPIADIPYKMKSENILEVPLPDGTFAEIVFKLVWVSYELVIIRITNRF